MTVLVAWAAVADAVVLAQETARKLTGRHPGPLFRLCPHCGSSEHGAPSFDGGPHVSIAHAPGLSVVAVSSAGPVGVDVEVAATREWVRREATGKAHGTGVLDDPSTDGVHVVDVDVPGHVAAVAVICAEPPRVRAAAAAGARPATR